MTQLFRELLAFHGSDTAEGKRNLEAFVNRTYEPRMRELLMTEASGSELIHTEFHKTVLEGAELARFARNFLPVVPLPSKTYEWTVQNDQTAIADWTPEGAPANIVEGGYSHVTFSARKVTASPLITDEMIADAAYGVMEMEVRSAGARIENKLNQYSLDQLMDNAGLEHDCAGADLGQKALIDAKTTMELAYQMPNKMLLHPNFQRILLKEVSLTDYHLGAELLSAGAVGKMFGMDAYVTTVPSASSTYTWNYTANSEIGALLFNGTLPAAVIGMRQDATIKDFTDVIRGIQGAVITSRFDVQLLKPNGVIRIEY